MVLLPCGGCCCGIPLPTSVEVDISPSPAVHYSSSQQYPFPTTRPTYCITTTTSDYLQSVSLSSTPTAGLYIWTNILRKYANSFSNALTPSLAETLEWGETMPAGDVYPAGYKFQMKINSDTGQWRFLLFASQDHRYFDVRQDGCADPVSYATATSVLDGFVDAAGYRTISSNSYGVGTALIIDRYCEGGGQSTYIRQGVVSNTIERPTAAQVLPAQPLFYPGRPISFSVTAIRFVYGNTSQSAIV
jgi:hypothetical protein